MNTPASFVVVYVTYHGTPQDRVDRDYYVRVRISVKVISGFGERDQGRKVVLRGQEIVA
ncbi:hypothetical protein [Cupriavidus pauculus]|uniref:hypothetical protein n=1 Tax=Cupriavidus pauculus TaxID=82633 RepID=UPI000B2924AB|nr:hypothetical protein [Cupriavidus pauculus]